MCFIIKIMADEKDINLNNEEDVELEGKKKGKRKDKKQDEPLPKTEEELYVESLSKAERKAYEKKKRALRRSQWVDEYWIIILLAVALLVVICALVISNTIRGISYVRSNTITHKLLQLLDAVKRNAPNLCGHII